MSICHLFVYGTLRRRYRRPARKALIEHVEFSVLGTMQGRLYGRQLSGSRRANEPVYNELYRVRDTAALFAVLDEYQKCSAGSGCRMSTVGHRDRSSPTAA